MSSVAQFSVATAETLLRQRYGSPDVNSQKMVSFLLPDGKAIALQRDVQRVQVWVEDDGRASPPPAQQIEPYAADRGRHSNLPARLSHSPDAELKGLGFPIPVFSVRLMNEDELVRLLEWYEGGEQYLNQAALERMKARFLATYPDFEAHTFAAKAGGYFEQERKYKDALIGQARALLENAGAVEARAFGGRFLDLLTGPESGLLGWRTDARIRNLREANPGVLEKASAKLVKSVDALPAAAAAFVEETWPALSAGQEKNRPYSESRNIPSMLLAFARPSEALGINTEPLGRLYKALRGKPLFGWNPMSADEYAEVLRFAGALFDKFSEWGWNPRDLWDVQSFAWVLKDSSATPQAAIAQPEEAKDMITKPTNLILYGPPGTGKTYRTAREAVRLCDGNAPEDRAELKARYDALVEAGQIAFVTFHQSYAYEDFVEGLRPVTGAEAEEEGAGFRLEPRRGIFREVAAVAEQARRHAGRGTGFDLSGRQFFKMSLGRAGSEDYIFDAAIEGNYIVLGCGLIMAQPQSDAGELGHGEEG